ncbi:AbrB family transcriptional regulator [Microbaculum marinum]|uniref:AbrB family transcriptional regulator n=1 Tax=Microbaculum marinum TaxID=1764581 RepID=A0AAW9RVF1_9HYPH
MAAAAHLTTFLKTLTTVAIGGVSGWVASRLGLPLAWMMGSMLTVGLIGMFGIKIGGHGVEVPHWLRTSMIPIIGVMLGSGFTPTVVAGIGEWWVTMLALIVFILLASAVAYQFYRRVFGFDAITSYFSSIPGGLIDMAIIGEAAGGDGRSISLVHFARILVSVLTIPFLMQWLYGPIGHQAIHPGASSLEIELVDVGLLTACAVVGYFGGRAIRLPGAQISGPLFLSAIAHGTQLTAASPPDFLIAVAQIVVGSSLGARFAGVSVRAAGKVMLASMCATALMFAVTIALALSLATFVDEPLPALILAYSPGGVAEMSLIALSMNVGVAFVTAHHIARIALSVGMMPQIWRRVVAPRVAAS